MEGAVIVICLVLVVCCWDRLAMAATFLFSDDHREERELQWLHLKLRFLKRVTMEIGKAEAEIEKREKETK